MRGRGNEREGMRTPGTGGGAWVAGVTEPPKIIPYYRLSLSTWPLSNNKELF
jgi:hypothetical protein